MKKTYSVQVILDGKVSGKQMDFSGNDARINLAGAMNFVKRYVKKGMHTRVVCGEEIIWDSETDK
jgi:hypothetical protein